MYFLYIKVSVYWDDYIYKWIKQFIYTLICVLGFTFS